MSHSLLLDACLFDLDGTLIDSTPPVVRCWSALLERHDLDPAIYLAKIHGRPAHESIRDLLSGKDEAIIEEEIRWLQHMESTDVEGIVALDGALDFIAELDRLSVPWTIVTSGSVPVAGARIRAAGIPTPARMITSDDITKGKPNPEPFLKGADLVGLAPEQCVVFEDAAAGITAGLAAGAQVIGITATQTAHVPAGIPAIASYRLLSIAPSDGRFALTIAR
ncbi:HAD family hydrolase [Cohaesibacter sp. CAU 1516]|uniref:HAD-IA family hydrolase n=1 Tax=Cohaesibacter sp. CAU 1516 TaxID=2576038 RepID=UPI0010FF19C0|nr:HAD-IA family hydrolase [Cohaesibacter sp. CAU 1516]TLP48412.1 HAD family hydrolase [Cohaesibacter sp. CAU 1516]